MSEENKTPQVHCPKCGSTDLYAGKKGFSGKKAIAGAVLTGGIGLFAGTIGSNKIKITCLNCGCVFKPGDSALLAKSKNISSPVKGNIYSTEADKLKGNSKDVNALMLKGASHKNFIQAYEAGNKEEAFALLKEHDPEANKYATADEAYKSFKSANQNATIGCILFVIVAAIILYFIFR
jgi:hypothetical protein